MTTNGKTWEEMEASERNTLIGELIGAKPLSQLYLALDGKHLWVLPKTEEDLLQMRQLVAQWQESPKEFKRWTRANSDIKEEWCGRITVEVHYWHIRYSEVPAGGWSVIAALRAKGFALTIYSEPVDNWRVMAKSSGSRATAVNAVSANIHEAACEVALRILAPSH